MIFGSNEMMKVKILFYFFVVGIIYLLGLFILFVVLFFRLLTLIQE
jgi:hypothetical protein